MTPKQKRDLTLTGLVVPWVVALLAIFLCSSANNGKERAQKDTEVAIQAKESANRQLAKYIEERQEFQRNCELTLKRGTDRLDEAYEIESKAKVALSNTTNVLKKFGFSSSEIQAFQSQSSDKDHLNSLTNKKALKHIPGENRPLNGNVIKNLFRQSTSKASLTMINGLNEDAYVKVIYDNSCIASFYVRSNNRFTLSGIPDSDYTIMYCVGFGWDSISKDFKRGRRAVKYDKQLKYKTNVLNNGNTQTTYYNQNSLTLHKSAFGNTTTTDINPNDFDRY